MRWSKKDSEFLCNNYSVANREELCLYFGRSWKSIKNKAYTLKLTKRQREWTKTDTEFLVKNYGEISVTELMSITGRTKKSITLKAFKLGLTCEKGEEWSEDDLNLLNDLYTKMSFYEIGKRLNSNRTVSAIQTRVYCLGLMTEENIKKNRARVAKENSGSNSPCWNGGSSAEGYGFGFTRLLKEEIREEFDYLCVLCNSESNIVHHIDYDKKNNDKSNLIVLCSSCHGKINFNRERHLAKETC